MTWLRYRATAGRDAGPVQFGLIAEEVAGVFREVVAGIVGVERRQEV